MALCLDCGKESAEEGEYCPECGSPREIRIPTDRELRKDLLSTSASKPSSVRGWLIMIVILLILLAVMALFLSRMISVQMTQLGRGFY